MKADMMEAMARERRHFRVKGKGDRKKKHGKGGKKKRKKNPRISRHGWITDPFISPLFCFPLLLLLLQSSIYLPHSMAKG